MAATVLGLTLTFGVPTLASLVVQSNNFREAVSIAEVQDEDGDFVSAALYGRKITGTVEAVDNGFTTAIGTILVITGAPTGNFYITEKSQTRTNTGFLRRSLGVTAWGGI
jgi:hypothetical protein